MGKLKKAPSTLARKRPPLSERILASLDEAQAFFSGQPHAVRVTVQTLTPVQEAIRDLIAARKAAPLTQKQLAKKSGIELKTIQKLELGLVRKPTVELLEQYAVAVGRKLTLTLG
jgi:DNA-binding XRE family transcriptional regulator